MRLFGTSGIRRLADYTLLDISVRLGLILGTKFKKVIVGTDTRTSSPSIKHALVAGLTASGIKVFDAGIAPTPTVALAGKDFDCTIMVTASHNPPEYNGIKLLNPDGSPFDEKQQAFIESGLNDTALSTVPWELYQNVEYGYNAVDKHISHIRRAFPNNYNVRVVVDCGGGAATVITPKLLTELGCEVYVINGTPTGFFPRPSEPIKDNLSDLKKAVMDFKADLGIAHDGDADRVMAVDDCGRFISGDVLLSIMSIELGVQRIVTTIDASGIVDELDAVSVIRVAVGDNSVSEALKTGGDFGAEPSGAWIFPQSSLCPDGILGAALLVSIAANNKLSMLAENINKYPIRRGHVSGKIDIEQVEERLVELFKPVSISKVDGVKISLEDGWALVRQSGTEPKIRITVEAKSEDRVLYIYNLVEKLITEKSVQ
jgi:phosphoglucosamine mutase